MSGSAAELLDAQGKPIRRRIPSDGSCPECGAEAEEFKPVLGGSEACMKCGHTRRQNG